MERIRCSAPLPEDTIDPLLTRMLAPAPYQVPAGEDKEENKEAQGSIHSGGSPGNLSGEISTPASKGGREGRTDIPSPYGKKRAASEDSEKEASKRGKVSQSGDVAYTQSPHKDRPSPES